MAQLCYPNTKEAEKGVSKVQDQPQLHEVLRSHLGHMKNLYKSRKNKHASAFIHLLNCLLIFERHYILQPHKKYLHIIIYYVPLLHAL